jgi:hypothetical protein
MGIHQIKGFYTSRETITRIKRQPTKWEKNLHQLFNREGINTQKIQRAQNTKYQKNK